jgi:hypothetical protein
MYELIYYVCYYYILYTYAYKKLINEINNTIKFLE